MVLMGLFKKFTNKFSVPETNLQLNLNKFSVALGENLDGTLVVSSREDIEADEVRCEIQCVEQARVIRQVYDAQLKRTLPREVKDSAVLFSARPALSGPTHLGNGETRNFSLNVNIPAGGQPTFQSIDRKVAWTIKGVVAVNGRPDATSRIAEIQVTPPSAQPVIREKEIVREVVMIPCKYCGSLMDQTVVSCPKCGANRTA